MSPEFARLIRHGSQPGLTIPTVELAWMNQASWRHCHFGLKSAPLHRDFRPGKVGLI